MGRRHSTRSIDARSDFNVDDEEEVAKREADDKQVLEYVNRRLRRQQSISSRKDAATFDMDDEEFVSQLDED